MPGPIATSLLISAGSSLLSAGANKLFNDKPEVPDFSSEIAGEFNNAQRQLAEDHDDRIEQAQADASAAGVNPVTAMADVIDSNSQAQADLMGKKADAITRAQNKEKQMRFSQDQRSHKATTQGIGSITNALSQAGSAYAMGQLGGGDETGGGGDGDGGGAALFGDNPLLKQIMMSQMTGSGGFKIPGAGS